MKTKNTKLLKTGSMKPVRGGSTHMSGQNSAGMQTPGQTTAGGAKKSAPFTSAAKAGPSGKVGKQMPSKPSRAGTLVQK